MRAAGVRYGVDGYPYLVGLSGGALALATAGILGARSDRVGPRRTSFLALAGSVALAVPALLGMHYVVRGKLVLRDEMLRRVPWRGGEVVADLGSGAGLLAVAAAGRTTGAVHCVDLFFGKDLLGNGPDRLLRNAERAGVLLDVRREDVRATSLADHSVDVVLSTLCLHNIGTAQGRSDALAEVVRILRPGGAAVISDLAHVEEEYVPFLRRAGLAVQSSGLLPFTFPPQRLLTAYLPESSLSESSA